MRRRRGIVIVGFLLLLAFATVNAQTKWKGTIVKEGDVTVVRNPKEPIYKTPILELKEDLSLGGPEAQGEFAFGRIQAFVVDDSGSIYVLDKKNYNIKVFDSFGNYLRTFGRRGQGPSELEYPFLLSLQQASGEIIVHDLSMRLSYFKTDGTFLRHLPLKTMMSLHGAVDSRGNLYVRDRVRDEKGVRFETKKLAPDGSLIALIAESPGLSLTNANPFTAISYFVVDRADNLVYGYPLTYEIRFYGASDQKVFRKIMREYDRATVTAEEREKLVKGAPPTVRFEFPKYHSAYCRFFMSDLGHLFVETWDTTREGKKVYDIFDAEGRFICRMPLKPSGVAILNGKYYALEEDEDGFQYVKRYTVTWKVK